MHFLVTSPTSRSPLLRDRCPCVLGRGEEVPGSLSPAPHPLALTQTCGTFSSPQHGPVSFLRKKYKVALQWQQRFLQHCFNTHDLALV